MSNIVVRAMPQVNGKWRYSDPWRSETSKPIKIKFAKEIIMSCSGPHARIGLLRVGIWARRTGKVVRSCTFFSYFVTGTEKTAQRTKTLNIPEHVSRACADS